MTLRILPLQAIGDEQVGGKAHGLARLVAMGLPVPAGFVIVDARPGRLPPDLGDHYRRLGAGPVAVRSSAFGEDSAEASFAGQYETLLNVRGEEAVRDAVDRCLDSLWSDRAGAYHPRHEAEEDEPATETKAMCVVVQCMVEARAAGVLFTVDPVSGRRSHAVIDAVEGLGEALVSGHSTPDHYVMARTGETLRVDPAGEVEILSDDERKKLLEAALRAEATEGHPLDLEWAIDRSGAAHWLQARPITALGADPNELDTPLLAPDHVYTRCNVGEMFPGACTPLSLSFTARGIDVAMQWMHERVGTQGATGSGMKFIAMFHGHLFLNLTTMSDMATQALGSSVEQMTQSLCGRRITEFEVRGRPSPPWPRRMLNGARYIRYLLGGKRARSDMKRLVAELDLTSGGDARAQWQRIDDRFHAIYDAMDFHLISSAGSGVLTPTLLGIVAQGADPREVHHAEVAALLAGTSDVESADIVAGAERLQTEIAARPDAVHGFRDASPEDALAWLRSAAAGSAGEAFDGYLERHGHRAVKELELRQAEWACDPIPLIRSLQVAIRANENGVRRQTPEASEIRRRSDDAAASHNAIVRAVIRRARRAVRFREETKSGLVAVTTRFKVAYRELGRRLVIEGKLPDDDAVFFLTHAELGRLVRNEESALAEQAVARRDVHDYQAGLLFPDVFVGIPEPLRPRPVDSNTEKRVTGAPVSRGKVTGRVRIVRSLEEANALETGEILVAPITDVGWTPYFSLIGGLVTDVGSAVSHGAVVAREYGLPAIVNTQIGTQVFETGDWVELDGDAGQVRVVDP